MQLISVALYTPLDPVPLVLTDLAVIIGIPDNCVCHRRYNDFLSVSICIP